MVLRDIAATRLTAVCCVYSKQYIAGALSTVTETINNARRLYRDPQFIFGKKRVVAKMFGTE
jgi:hypothetical protein